MTTETTKTESVEDLTTISHYGLLLFLTLLNIINFIDRQLLTNFANFIVPDLGVTKPQFGLLTGVVFLFFYAVMGLIMGALADHYHRPRLIAMALLLWSVLTAASGAARSFVSLAIPRMFIAVGESALTPASMSMLADKFPPDKRGFAAGFYYMGVPVCGELVLKPRQADGIGLGSDYASGRNLDLQPSVVSSRFLCSA